MSPLSSSTSSQSFSSNHEFSNEGRYKILTFLNLEKGGPGPEAVNLAITTAILLYVIPRRLPTVFPSYEDRYPLLRQRMAIGTSTRDYLQRNPGLQRVITLAGDTIFIASSLYILFHRQLQQKEPVLVASCFPASCLLIHGMRVGLYSVALLFKEKGPRRVSSIANKIANFIRPNVWYPREPLWSG